MRQRGMLLLGLMGALAGCLGPDPIETRAPGTPFTEGPFGSTQFLDQRIVDGTRPVALVDGETPPPITGGTLFITSSGDTAIVSDPDRNRVVVVDLVAGRTVGETTSLPPGAEPFRAVEDGAGHVHVVLRGSGDVLSFSPSSIATAERTHVCAMPRGIAFDADADALVVACRSGALVTLGTDGTLRSELQLDRADLRDVVIENGRLFVSTFRSAELLEVQPATGEVLQARVPATSQGGGFFFEDGAGRAAAFSPSVAWRTVSVPGNAHTIAAVHQRASDGAVEPQPGGYGGGGGRGCGESGIVESAVTFYGPDGSPTSGAPLMGATMPVDIAFSHDGSQATVIAAANQSGQQAVQSYDTSFLMLGESGGCAAPTSPLNADGSLAMITNAVAAAYDGADRLVVQQREPARLVHIVGNQVVRTIELGGPSRYDTGHAVFHANSGAFIACGSCHPEGGDDGRVWSFDGIGPRRTPALHGELTGTEPFHWDGDMTDLNVLVHQVFTSRMSGPELAVGQVDTLGNWLDHGIQAPAHEAGIDPAAVARGQRLFYGEAECGTCHSGGLMTNNATMDVGTGGPFQVPSLIGVAYRTPLMHDGSCPTLRARLVDATCGGGDRHGHTSQLSPADIDDMVAFLTTL